MHRRQGRRPVQTPGARADGATSGHHPGADDPRVGLIPAGMGRLLRLQPVARVAIPRQLDSAAPTLRRLGPVEDARQAIPGTQPTWRTWAGGQRGRLQPKRPVAVELHARSAPCLHQRALQKPGSASYGKAGERLIRRTAVYGPVRTVVWEGRHREMPPYPDLQGLLIGHARATEFDG